MKKELAQLRADLAAQQVLTLKLFEALLFMKPLLMEQALDYLQRYADEVQAEGGEPALWEAQSLRSQLALLRQVQAQRASAVSMRAVLARTKSGSAPPAGQ